MQMALQYQTIAYQCCINIFFCYPSNQLIFTSDSVTLLFSLFVHRQMILEALRNEKWIAVKIHLGQDHVIRNFDPWGKNDTDNSKPTIA